MTMRMFIHGLESSDQGTKAVFFRERYPGMLTPHFTGSLAERMAKLNGILSQESGIILVGSSYGGLMASIYAMDYERRIERLILLAPAINLVEFNDYRARTTSLPVWIYHGSHDEVIPLEDVKEVARKVFSLLSFHEVEDDHYLSETFKTLDWDHLLA